MSNRQAERQLAELSAFVHGLLAGLHILGIAYNLKRRNKWDVFAHTAAAIYDIRAVTTHVHDIRELSK
jgi:hypothetical protein